MQEIILYAVLAIVVGAMLYSVLGKNVGHDVTKDVIPEDFKKAFLDNDKPYVPDAEVKFEGAGAKGLSAIAKADQSFSVPQFLDGAKAAYGMILESYADGDKETLRELLNDDVYAAYAAAIDEREAKGLRQSTDLARLISAEIVDAGRDGKTGLISVLYDAELATALIDSNGDTVEGDMDLLARVKEVWEFERALAATSPNWILRGVEPQQAEGGAADSPDHSPDVPPEPSSKDIG